MDCARCRLHCGCGGLCFWLVLRDAACIVVVVRFVFVWLFACLHYGCGRCCFCLVVRDAAWIVVAASFFFWFRVVACVMVAVSFVCLVVRAGACVVVAVGFVFVWLFALSLLFWLRWALFLLGCSRCRLHCGYGGLRP